MAYGKGTPHQLCQSHPLREYTRNIGKVGFSEAKALLGSSDMARARECVGRIVELTGGKALYWVRQSVGQRADAAADRRG